MQQIDPVLFAWLLKTTLQMSTPLVITALGGMFSERSGVVNIGLEGMMLTGAFAAAAGSHYTGNPWLGVLCAIAAGAGLGFIHALVCVKFKGNQIVSGTGIILAGFGLTTVGLEVIWGRKGVSDSVTGLPNMVIPGIGQIPLIGGFLEVAISSISPLVVVMFLLVPACYYVMYKTPLGLRIRSAGEDPSTLDTAGVDVDLTRMLAVVVSGALAGLGGAHLSIGIENFFAKNMTAGRGFISLAALIFGNWTPIGCFLAGLFFGFLYGLQYFVALQFPDLVALSNFFRMIPFAVVIVTIAGIRRSIPPRAIGVPYEKEQRA
ncbi:MAG: ABC transporter permease [Candidatus Thorarchaeota archaeon]